MKEPLVGYPGCCSLRLKEDQLGVLGAVVSLRGTVPFRMSFTLYSTHDFDSYSRMSFILYSTHDFDSYSRMSFTLYSIQDFDSQLNIIRLTTSTQSYTTFD
ncbi:hypothetical protein Taro_037603 [Colocasia esculenta]|uniref:Uncharacterized protein n=1 Tax=Colocasia esculenta TaxID=4460 RepID=A0A843WJR5_COLES|nr:hypothetical protein [Colocasia esculenta]